MSITTKNVNNFQYLYFIYHQNGVKKEIYCGSASNPESKRKAIKIEINYLKEQKMILSEKIRKLEKYLKKK